MKNKLLLSSLVLLILPLTACGAATQESAEPTPGTQIDKSPSQVMAMPKGFRNVATKCLQGTSIRVFVTSRGNNTDTSLPSGVAAIEDPSCSDQASK